MNAHGELWLTIPINAEPWAVGPVGTRRGNGGKLVGYVGRNEQLHNYKMAVGEQIKQKLGEDQLFPVFDKGTKLEAAFWFWRERADYETHQARTARKNEIDATNALKACEDALQGIVYANDKDNQRVVSEIVEQAPSLKVGNPFMVIRVRPYVDYTPEIPASVMSEALGHARMEF